ncbi:MAG: ABC transporter permease [Candidatus Bipolaricaulota bacterium]|nr:ABC transporter permease [Candidatus Bipolaricaulota bacterium]
MTGRIWIPASLIAAILGLWEGAVRAFHVPFYLLPPPSRILLTFVTQFPTLAHHGAITLAEIVLGLAIATAFGLLLALALHASPSFERALRPFMLASQMIPVFAIAPLLVVWLGYGIWPKVVVTALIGFFPVAVSEWDGLRTAGGGARDLLRSMGATRRQLLTKLLLPASLPSFFSGLKVAATLSVVGATIGEWVGARRGLGFLMLESNARLRVDLVFASILMLTLVGLLLYAALRIIERHVLRWREPAGGGPAGSDASARRVASANRSGG